MNPLKTQYFFAYAVMGSLIPYLAIYLKQVQGLTEGQIGIVLGVGGVSILLPPILITLLADTKVDPRRLTCVAFGVSSLALLALYFSHGFWLVIVLLTFHSLAYVGTIPLLDGMTFSIQRHIERDGRSSTPYYKIRVWGTIGFILPSLILFVLLEKGWSTAVILLCGVAFGLVALVNVFRLADPRLRAGDEPAAKLPTAMAARLLLQPNMRIFCAAMFLAYLGLSAFGSFYPLYMVETVGVAEQWVGLIYNFGVVIEIGFMLSLGWLHARLGLRKIMLVGIACYVVQTLALGLFPTVLVAVLSQSLHGMIILALFISPIMYINEKAGDRFRNSIQGLYSMAILGVSRIIGMMVAGQVAEVNLRILPFAAAGLAIVALALFLFAFKDHDHDGSANHAASGLPAE